MWWRQIYFFLVPPFCCDTVTAESRTEMLPWDTKTLVTSLYSQTSNASSKHEHEHDIKAEKTQSTFINRKIISFSWGIVTGDGTDEFISFLIHIKNPSLRRLAGVLKICTDFDITLTHIIHERRWRMLSKTFWHSSFMFLIRARRFIFFLNGLCFEKVCK